MLDRFREAYDKFYYPLEGENQATVDRLIAVFMFVLIGTISAATVYTILLVLVALTKATF